MAHGIVRCHDAQMLNQAVDAGEFKPITGGLRLHGWLLLIWFIASFGVVFFAHDLQMVVSGWPVGYWFVAQGSVFIFIAIVAVFAWLSNRRDGEVLSDDVAYIAYKRRIHRRFAIYVFGYGEKTIMVP